MIELGLAMRTLSANTRYKPWKQGVHGRSCTLAVTASAASSSAFFVVVRRVRMASSWAACFLLSVSASCATATCSAVGGGPHRRLSRSTSHPSHRRLLSFFPTWKHHARMCAQTNEHTHTHTHLQNGLDAAIALRQVHSQLLAGGRGAAVQRVCVSTHSLVIPRMKYLHHYSHFRCMLRANARVV